MKTLEKTTFLVQQLLFVEDFGKHTFFCAKTWKSKENLYEIVAFSKKSMWGWYLHSLGGMGIAPQLSSGYVDPTSALFGDVGPIGRIRRIRTSSFTICHMPYTMYYVLWFFESEPGYMISGGVPG